MKLTRRQFLGLSALTAGTAAVAAVPLCHDPQYDVRFPIVPENHVELPSNGKSVCILGGGLAGIQAGVELAARGFKVTVLEKTGHPGGKLKTWRDKNFGPPDHPIKKQEGFRGVVREHGVHGIWYSYKNLREFMARYGYKTEPMPPHSMDYLFIDRDGKRSLIPEFGLPSPYNKIQQLLNAFFFEHTGNPEESARLIKVMMKMSTYDLHDPKQRDYLDGISFAQYAKEVGLSQDTIYKFFESVAEMVYYDRVDHVSALSMVTGIMLTAGSPQNWNVELYANPAGETFLEPMANYIRSRGGQVINNAEIGHLDLRDGKIDSVYTSAIPQNMRVRRCQVCGELIYGDDEHHNCPFCGADSEQFKDLNGVERQERQFKADNYIIAMDVPGLQKVMANNPQITVTHEYFKKIMKLRAQHVYVANFWIDGTKFWREKIHSKERPVFIFFPTSFERLGVTLNWGFAYQDKQGHRSTVVHEYADHDISVIETHISRLDTIAALSDRQIADLAYDELKELFPGLPDFQSFYLNKWRNYTGVRVGEEKNRPTIQSPVDNLLFIGDLVSIPHVATGMEKTNVTAKMATNILLEKIGQKTGAIKILQSGTPSLFVDCAKTFMSVYPNRRRNHDIPTTNTL